MCILFVCEYVCSIFWDVFKEKIALKKKVHRVTFFLNIKLFPFIEAKLFWGVGVGGIELLGLKLQRNLHITKVVIS